MRRLKCWKYWLPRVMLLVVLLLVVEYTLGRLVRSSIIRAGKAVVGGEVELGGARVSLARAQVVLHDLRIGDPREPAQCLLRAKSCQLDLGAGFLFHTKTTIRRGEVAGLRIGVPSGASGAVAAPAAAGFDRRTAELAQQWLNHLEEQFSRDQIDQLESVKLADGLLARWPQRSAELNERLRQLRQRATALEVGIRDAQVNPLRHEDFLDGLPDEVASLRCDYNELTADIEKLPDAVEADRRAIIAARRRDEQLLRTALDVDQIDPTAMAAYLLQDEVAGPTAELVGWLRWARQVLPAQPPAAGNSPRSGPDYRVASLAVGGTAWVGGMPLALAGTIADLASDPVASGRPIQVRMTTAGALPLVLSATLDRTQAAARDELSARCQNVALPASQLGRSDRLRLSLGPTVAAAKLHVLVDGDRLSGQVELLERQVRITPHTTGTLEQIDVAKTLAESLGDVGSVTVRLSLSGTLDQPRWTLQSDLGPVVAQAMDRVLDRAAEGHAKELLARSQRHVDEQLARLDRQIADQQAALLPQLAGSVRMLDAIAQGQQLPERLSPEYVGRRLPTGSLFR